MEQRPDPLAETGLQFFGKISASISHEIKNALAILNENAGLLEDFCFMAEKGKTIEPERLKKLAGNLLKQVRRADDIVRRMNRFSHSVDEPVSQTDLGDVVGLVVSLSNRFISNKNVTVAYTPPPSPVTVTTNPYFLENLLFQCLDQSLDAAGAGKSVAIAVEQGEDGPAVTFTGLTALAEAAAAFPGEREARIMELLSADVRVDAGAGKITVAFPD